MVGVKRRPIRPLSTTNLSLAFPGELLIDPTTGNFTYIDDSNRQVVHKKPGKLTVKYGDTFLVNGNDLSSDINFTIPKPAEVTWDTIKPDSIDASMINGLTANRILISSAAGKLTTSAVSSTTLNYLSGLTGNVQTQLNSKIGASGGTVSGTLTISGALNVTGNATGISKEFTGTLYTTGWTGSAAPYTQAVTVNGMLSTDEPICDYRNSGIYATDQAREEAWLNVYRGVTVANKITFYAHEKPTVAIPFMAKVIR